VSRSQVVSNLRMSEFEQVGHGSGSLSSQKGVPEAQMASTLISLCGVRDYEQATRSNRCCLLLRILFLGVFQVRASKRT